MSTQEGPISTDCLGELKPVLMCWFGVYRCRHLGIRGNYHWCAAQAASLNDFPHPWREAGKLLRGGIPNSGCPFLAPAKEEQGGHQARTASPA